MINNYWFFCVSIVLIGNHVLGMDFTSPRNDDNNKQIITIPGQKAQWNKLKQLIDELDVPTPQRIESDIEILLCPPSSYALDYFRKLPIFEAIHNNDLETVKEIIEDVDTYDQLEATDNFGTSLLVAVHRDKIEIARYLISMGANINASTHGFFKQSVVHLTGSLEMLTILLEVGININALDELEQSILDRKWGSLDQYELDYSLELIKKGARFHKIMKEISICNGIPGKTLMYKALLFAFVENDKELAQHFLEFCKIQEVDLCSKDVNGNTLLHHLMWSEPKEDRNAKARLLLEYFPKLGNVQNEAGDTPLHCAIGAGDNALVSLLIRYGVDVFIENKDNFTACNFALNDAHLLKILFRYGSIDDVFLKRDMEIPKNTITKIEYVE